MMEINHTTCVIEVTAVTGFTHRGIDVEATVVQKLNQGTIPKKGCNLFRGSFFGYFFGEAKK